MQVTKDTFAKPTGGAGAGGPSRTMRKPQLDFVPPVDNSTGPFRPKARG